MKEKEDIEHLPVMMSQVISFLHIKNQARYIDATLGAGGHTLEILKKGGIVLGIDADPYMLMLAKKRIEIACPVPKSDLGNLFVSANGNFKDIANIASKNNFTGVDGVLMDLGISNVHLQSKDRGFSFKYKDAPLDMRLDKNIQALTAADLLNTLSEKQLFSLFKEVLTWNEAKSITTQIVEYRSKKKIFLVSDLLEIVEKSKISDKKHPATRIFMTLRIAVNSELDILRSALPEALSVLGSKGRLAVITFHSGEDRVVKEVFNSWEGKFGKVITPSPLIPTESEVLSNPKARSAKLRVFEKK